MDEQKRNRIAAAFTVNAIVLIVIIAAVLIYQMVQIQLLNSRKNDLIDKIAMYEDMIANDSEDLDYYTDYQYLVDKAYEYGFRFPD